MKSPPARPPAVNRNSPVSPPPTSAPLPERGAFAAPANVTLAAALRARLPGQSWSALRRLCVSGKVSVSGQIVVDPAARLAGGEAIEWRMNARDVRRDDRPSVRLVHEDVHLVVIDKPEGVTTVPYERKETGTALDLIRDAWRQKGRKATVTPLYVVHRIDKDTSGLLVFAKTKLAERGLHTVFKQHLADREYLAVAEGHVQPGRIESRLVPDRGDGIRGSTRAPNEGQPSVTHVTVDEYLPAASLCRVRLETGRTHQIRIHLSEAHHPLVGETVYIRDLLRAGLTPLPSPRLLLARAHLGVRSSRDRRAIELRKPAAGRLPPRPRIAAVRPDRQRPRPRLRPRPPSRLRTRLRYRFASCVRVCARARPTRFVDSGTADASANAVAHRSRKRVRNRERGRERGRGRSVLGARRNAVQMSDARSFWSPLPVRGRPRGEGWGEGSAPHLTRAPSPPTQRGGEGVRVLFAA